MTSRTRIKARIPEAAMVDLANDIDDAIARRDVTMLAAFAAEAEQTAGLDQQAARAREVLSLLETKAAEAGRLEVQRLKAELEPPDPTQAELVRRFDREFMARDGGSFSVNDHERLEAERAAEANRQVAARQRRHEEQRAAQVSAAAEPKGPGR